MTFVLHMTTRTCNPSVFFVLLSSVFEDVPKNVLYSINCVCHDCKDSLHCVVLVSTTAAMLIMLVASYNNLPSILNILENLFGCV